MLPLLATPDERLDAYRDIRARIESLLTDEDDWIAAMATVACELHHSIEYFHWTGFYRPIAPELLAIGPYQGTHGCLRIPFSRGVCGAAARTRTTQLIPDVHAFPDHIACSATTRSEIVVPILHHNTLLALLDIDSNHPDAFHHADQHALESLATWLGQKYAPLPPTPSAP